MHRGINLIEEISPDEISKWGYDQKAVCSTIITLNKALTGRKAPLRIYFHPDLEKYSKQAEVSPPIFFKILTFLTIFRPKDIHISLFFHDEESNFDYQLFEEDLEILKTEKIFHNPKNPEIIYENPYEILRHAFIVGGF